MRIKVLGSGAYEGFPAIFCNCDSCIKAREAGGKNIRTRSQFYIDDDLMIDFGDDTFCHSVQTVQGKQLYSGKSLKIITTPLK